jgi:hypothetical protein
VRVFFPSIYCSHSPIPIRPFFACAGLREEKPAPFTKIVKSAVPDFGNGPVCTKESFQMTGNHCDSQLAAGLTDSLPMKAHVCHFQLKDEAKTHSCLCTLQHVEENRKVTFHVCGNQKILSHVLVSLFTQFECQSGI